MINKELRYEDFKPFLGLCLDLRYLALLNNAPGVEQHEVINDLEKVLEKLNLKLIKVEFEKNSDHYWTRAIVPANLDILLHLSVFEKIKGLIIGTGGENVNRIKSRYFIKRISVHGKTEEEMNVLEDKFLKDILQYFVEDPEEN